MDDSSFKQTLENRLYGDIWGATTPQEAAQVLREVYKARAVEEAFCREVDAWKTRDPRRVEFWSCVQKHLVKGSIKKPFMVH